ncbi:MAG: hypothetical protein IT573_00355 [Deltaproteobacteria bacterium]|nr:hypothetical protein [Deltaproteobacteria bacterium]
MGRGYPLSVGNDRVLPAEYAGPAFVWDIDKTYLSTAFSSWRGLARVPVEFAVDKRAIPGMPEVLRGLRRGPGREIECRPLYFISASPPFLRGTIEGKMLLDGVEHDGITFKDWLRTLLELRPGRLFEQLGFKMAALLRGRLDRPRSREYLFGDDYERDAAAYSLYARWLHGELKIGELDETLASERVAADDRRHILAAAGRIPEARGRVGRIYIHLERNSRPQDFKKYGELLVAVRGAWQLSLALYQEGLVDLACVRAARDAVLSAPDHRFGDVRELGADALKRKLISREKWRRLGKL